MEFGQDNYQDFFNKLESNNDRRNLRQIFEDDDKPLQKESKNLRYQHQSTCKQPKHKQQYLASQHLHKQQEHNHHEPKYKSKVHSPGPHSKHQDLMATECWNTIVAKVAHGFNGNDNVGRVGVALSRNKTGASKLVVYKSRSQLLSTLLLTKSLESSTPRTGQSNVRLRESYMQFYDDGRRFWSLRFEQPKDEEMFTGELLKLGLSIDNMRTEEENKMISSSLPVVPKPIPRQEISTSDAEPSSTSNGYDSDTESTQSTEDVTSDQPSVNKNALIPIATNGSNLSVASPPHANAAEQAPTSRLELYLDQLRGRTMGKRMDTILQAMYYLSSSGRMNLNDSKDSVSGDPQNSKKLESILQAMSRMGNKNGMKQMGGDSVDTTHCINDNEDELLDLEQKLLDLKKENRTLMKSLISNEQALSELRISTCALCEELLTQNNELKEQNSTLVAALSDQANNTVVTVNRATSPDYTNSCFYGSGHCMNCNRYLDRISELERRIYAITYNNTTRPKSGQF